MWMSHVAHTHDAFTDVRAYRIFLQAIVDEFRHMNESCHVMSHVAHIHDTHTDVCTSMRRNVAGYGEGVMSNMMCKMFINNRKS